MIVAKFSIVRRWVLLYNSRDICTLVAFYSALSTFGTHFKLNLWKPRTSCRFLWTTSLGTANCRARWRVELNSLSFSGQAIWAETSIKGPSGRTAWWRSVLCALNSRAQYFTVPSEYESVSYTSDSCGEFSFLLCPVCNHKRSRLASRFSFCRHWQM
jgi:hypothetical protein